MDSTFAPSQVEPRWRERWEELGVGTPPDDPARPAFVIALPPPNITGALHLGHAVQQSVQDILCRQRRMRGDAVEWCPGTDHAAIATQNVIERQLADEGTTKEELGREAFGRRVQSWYAEYGGRILEQMRRLGFTCDWTRTRFTLDEPYVRAIHVAFKALYDEGLIYRGPRIVNWCPRCQSAISDEEVEWEEHHDRLYHLRYPVEGGDHVEVATVRPETMLADTGVAVAPGDARHARLVGRTAVLPITSRAVPIVEDDAVKPEFGTGALKVTPGHDPVDYEIGRRHSLPVISVIGADGRMDVPDLPQFHGLTVEEARAAVTEVLRATGALVGEEEYVHEVGHCDRCGSVLEPLVSEQWWMAMTKLAAPAITAVESGAVRFHPARYGEVYLRWMRSLRDWCISRQLWLGHAIPVATCANGHRFAWIDAPERCEVCGSTDLTPDPDVLDTWFSSALWPFAIFGWPEQTADLRRFHPTDVLVTAREIIFLWVARMIMTGLRFTGSRPFHDVIINTTVLAPDGSRMSKSKGNVVDPLDMVERYGADAVRAWAGAVGTSSQDVRFDEDRIASYQKFANKLWNVTKLLVTRLGDGERISGVPAADPSQLLPEDRWILARVADTVRDCDSAIASYRFHDAMDRLYDVAWHTYCDWYVEMAKARLRDAEPPPSRDAAAHTLVTALDTILRLLHPFMPFVTEECAQRLPGPAATLQARAWPQAAALRPEDGGDGGEGVEEIIDFVQRLRHVRQESGVRSSDRTRHPLVVHAAPDRPPRDHLHRLLETLAPVTVTDRAPGNGAVRIVAGRIDAALHLGAAAEAERSRLRRQLDEVRQRVEQLRRQLDNRGFLEGARPDVVAQARRRLEEAEGQRETLTRLLDPDL